MEYEIYFKFQFEKKRDQAVSSFLKLQQHQKSKLKFLKDGMDNRIQKKLGLAHIKRYFIKSIQLDKVCPYKSCLVIQQM